MVRMLECWGGSSFLLLLSVSVAAPSPLEKKWCARTYIITGRMML